MQTPKYRLSSTRASTGPLSACCFERALFTAGLACAGVVIFSAAADGELLDVRWTAAGHLTSVDGVAFSQDGALSASASADGTVKIWRTVNGRHLRTVVSPVRSPLDDVVFTPDGESIIAAGIGGAFQWRLEDGEFIRHFCCMESSHAVAVSPDGQTLAVGGAAGGTESDVMLFRLSDGVLLNHFVGTNGLVTYDVMFSLDGQTVLTGEGAIFLTGPGGAIRYWDIATQTAVRVLTDHAFSVHALAMSPDGQTFASASHDQTIKLWNLADGELLDTLTGHTNAVTGVDFVGDGTTLVSSSVDATVRIWNTATGELTQTITGFDDAVGAVEFSPDGQHILASGGKFNLQVSDPAVRLIRLADGRIEQTLTQFNSVFESVAISPDDRWVAVGGSSHEFTSGLVAIRSAIDGSLVRMINGGTWVNAIAFSPDGGRIASAGFDNLVKIWNPETGDLIRTLTGHPDEIYALAYSPGGEFLASAGWNNPIRIWNPESGALLQQLSGLNPSGALSLAFSPDGTLLAAGIDRYAHIVRVSDWQHIHSVIHVPVTTGGTVRTVAFSPDGAVLAVSGTPNVTLWNPNTGALLRTLSGHTSDVRTLAFTPDGAFLISGCERTDLSLRVWRVADGAQVASFDDGTGSGARRVAVSSDGRQVAIAQSDSTLSVVRSPAGPLAGDVDGNGAYTSVDHAAFVDCLSGPAVPVGDDYQCAVVFDLTNDGHVDLQDFAALQ